MQQSGPWRTSGFVSFFIAGNKKQPMMKKRILHPLVTMVHGSQIN